VAAQETLPSAAARNWNYRSRGAKASTMPDQAFGTLLIVFRMREMIW
jgi:hypothetical protein